MTIRGRYFTHKEIEFITQVVSNNSSLSRRKLSITICEKLDWRQPNGRLKDRACRDVLLKLNVQGIVKLPHPLERGDNRKLRIRSVNFVEPTYKLTGKAGHYGKPLFQEVKTKKEHRLWNYLVERYHYLGCKVIVGHYLKYLIYLEEHLIGCLAFGDGILHLNVRDRWIGWDKEGRKANLHLVINNRRFLLLPWVEVKYLASRVLSGAAKVVSSDWKNRYGYQPALIETFIDKKRFSGRSYKAANWICLGETIGQGRKTNRYFYHGRVKQVYVYPSTRNARKILCSHPLQSLHNQGRS